jgi:RHS repeat-associated protein
VHVDHRHRPILLTDSAKTTVWSASYEPFGKVRTLTGTVTQNLGLPGQWFQLEHGLAYNWHRHYDPTTGRYTTPDPLGFVDGPSVFAYAGSDPLASIDLTGANRRGRPQNQPGYDAFGRPQLEPPPRNPQFNGLNPIIRGRQGEQAVRNTCNIGEPTRFEINGNRRVADGMTTTTLSEVKNRQYIPLSRQLRDSMDFARENNLGMDLFLPPSGRVSGPLQNSINSGAITRRDIP